MKYFIKPRIIRLFFALLFFALFQHTTFGAGECKPPSEIYYENLSEANIDIGWNEVAGAEQYFVVVTLGDEIIFEGFTEDTGISISGTSFATGDNLTVNLTTYCSEGGQSSTGTFAENGIIVTVDIVFRGMPCASCDYVECGRGVYYSCECGCPGEEGFDPEICQQQLALYRNLCITPLGGMGLSAELDEALIMLTDGKSPPTPKADNDGFAIVPNPSYRSPLFKFYIQKETEVSLIIFDQMGRIVKSLMENQTLSQGDYQFALKEHELIGGIYYCSFITGDQQQSIKFVKTH